MNKLTDEILIKWWEDEVHLAEYVDSDYRDGIKVDYIKLTLDLINRRKAEIDILIRKNETLKDEISKLENEVETWKRTADYNAKKYAELVKELGGD